MTGNRVTNFRLWQWSLLIVIWQVCTPVPSRSAVIHIPGDYATIQSGIDASVDGDTVLIADGTYSGPGNTGINYYGRDVLVTSETGPMNCIIDCLGLDRGFYFHSGETSSSVLSGVTVRNGRTKKSGGAVLIDSASPLIQNCRFESNTASRSGGAIHIRYGSPVIGGSPGMGNYFSGNLAGTGADLDALEPTEEVINAGYNTFAGYYHSDYYLTPELAFNTWGSMAELDPIRQNVYVAPNGDDTNDGLTAQTPFKTIQHALSRVYSASGGVLYIYLAAGEYSPETNGEVFPLPMVSNTWIYGENPATTRINAQSTEQVMVGVDDKIVIVERVTITGGFSSDGPGGVSVSGWSRVGLIECVITDNRNGGIHIALDSGEVKLIECEIHNNIAIGNTHRGGGCRIDSVQSAFSIQDSTVTGNQCTGTNARGGGFYIGPDAGDVKILENTISENTVAGSSRGGGIFVETGQSSIVIQNNEFLNNSAGYGGGIACAAMTGVLIGGPYNGNFFSGNRAGAGSDMFADAYANATDPPAQLIPSGWNHFAGYGPSDYYVSPHEAFDTSHWESDLIPITSDVYVSGTGSDLNDGLSLETPFRTINHAMSRIYAESGQTLTVHVGPGVYSAELGEVFPVPLCDGIEIRKSGEGLVILDAGEVSSVLIGYGDDGTVLSGLDVHNGNGYRGGGLDLFFSSPLIEDCTVSGCEALFQGGGISCRRSASPIIRRSSLNANAAASGGGLYCDQNSVPELENTILSANLASGVPVARGGAIFTRSALSLMNCTATANRSDDEGGGIYFSPLYSEYNPVSVTNSIFWDNSPDDLRSDRTILPTETEFLARFSTVSSGVSHLTVSHRDPMFSNDGLYRLSAESPCIDAGTDEDAPDKDRDGAPRPAAGAHDTGAYEYDGRPAFTRVYIDMPAHFYYPGDPFSTHIRVWNAETFHLENYPLFIILDIHGQLFFAPDFSGEVSYYDDLIFPAEQESAFELIPVFQWPDSAGTMTGLAWYGGFTTPDMSAMYGELGVFYFGWSQ